MFKLMFSNDDQISQVSSSKQHSQRHPGFISNHYPLVNVYIAIENGPVEIVDIYPLKNGGSFHSFLYVYQSVLAQKNGPTSKPYQSHPPLSSTAPPIKVIWGTAPDGRTAQGPGDSIMIREALGREDVLVVDG